METLIVLLVVIIVFFSLVIFWGLRFRSKAQVSDKQIRAKQLRDLLGSPAPGPAGLLYGVWEDFSAFENGMIVRDGFDAVVGKITYRTGARSGRIAIEAGNERFEVDVMPTFRHKVTLYAAANRNRVLATCERRFTSNQFEVLMGEVGAMQAKRRGVFDWTSTMDYKRAGQTIGLGRGIGKYRMQGKVLALPPELPLPVRIFFLAMQRI